MKLKVLLSIVSVFSQPGPDKVTRVTKEKSLGRETVWFGCVFSRAMSGVCYGMDWCSVFGAFLKIKLTNFTTPFFFTSFSL